jgi:hypothetical protein
VKQQIGKGGESQSLGFWILSIVSSSKTACHLPPGLFLPMQMPMQNPPNCTFESDESGLFARKDE